MSKPIYPIQALHKHDVIQNTTICDHTNCSSTNILPNSIKTNGQNHHMENKREGQKKGQKLHNLQELKKGES
jgi:hypothetical protein